MAWSRRALVSTVVLAMAGALAACSASSSSGGGDASSGPVTLTLYLSGDVNIKGMWDNVVIPGFTRDNPGYKVKMVFSEHGVNDTVTLQRLTAAAKANQNPGADLFEAAFVQSAASSGLLTDVTAQDVPNLSKVSPAALTAVGGKAAPYRGSSVVLAYDSKKVPNPPKTLDDLLAWIKANPGKFTYNSPNSGGSGYSFTETVLDRYVPPADLAKMDTVYDPSLEKSWDRGWQELHALTKSMYQGTYPNGNNAVIDLLGRGQIWMAPVWSDQALSGLKNGQLAPSVKLEQITQPAFTGGLVYLGVPKNADDAHKQAAFKLENWMLDPAHQAQIVNAVQGYPAIELNYLPAATANIFAGIDTSNLRANYEAHTQNDVKQQWQSRVP
jgi:putative spermidine/putrescine transport system substrate-binding protein